MKNLTLSFCAVLFLLKIAHAQDENVIAGLNTPAFGVLIKANFPGTGDWSRGYFISNQDNSQKLFGLGAYGPHTNGISSLGYGWIGKDYNQSFMNFLPNGNVGIGTTNPAYLLHLSSNHPVIMLTSTNSTEPFSAIRGNNATWLFGYDGQQGQEDISIGTQDGSGSRTLTFAAGGISRMKILSNGNIGIGTSMPIEKLSVNGKIRAQEVKVETSNWPDYVFAEDYKPASLKELEKFVKTNKHLPEMPTAKEAEANGVNLGEMNKLLLKKVEELTLHLIEKDKEILKLKEGYQKIESLEKQLNQILNKK